MTQSYARRAWRNFAIGFAATATLAAGIGLNAQVFGGHNANAPVNFDAGRLEVQDRQNRVVLSGAVTVTQAGLTVRSNRMVVNYSDAGTLDIGRITATGGVTVTRGNERAQGDVAIYDLNRRIITMAGNVRLNRGGDNLSGGRLVIDLNSGVSSVDGSAAPGAGETGVRGSDGRVRGTFSVPQG
ncbi:LptA/OstA family protein [Erythrobacter litoralis]|uniref:Organic solvent tolerance-like N-terminal domain-containing protein n=1 Tax=Erythrobacter litoralis (strain HTCC2594) TaxID=314225 RepID=Q2N715_ERYLH|nr:LptA/OstA family protein [Erythrobacter litoralis]ABC64526.1 hypothetical protein ELI_12170 [Erythrobacter litoralis HTCC2594]